MWRGRGGGGDELCSYLPSSEQLIADLVLTVHLMLTVQP